MRLGTERDLIDAVTKEQELVRQAAWIRIRAVAGKPHETKVFAVAHDGTEHELRTCVEIDAKASPHVSKVRLHEPKPGEKLVHAEE